MPFYLVTRPAAAIIVGTDLLTITSVGKSLNVWSIDLNGVANASLAGELKLAFSSGGATAGGSITPTRVDRNNATAASFLARHTWTTQPTIAGSDADLWLFSVNANGGKDRFPGYPQPLPVPINGQASLRVLIGNHVVDQTWLVEEIG